MRASAQAPARHTTRFTEEEPSHPLHAAHNPTTPQPWTLFLWPYQGVKPQTLQFTAFLTTITTALDLLQKGLLQSWQSLGVTKRSLQLQRAKWCRATILTTQLNSSRKPRPVATSALNSPKKTPRPILNLTRHNLYGSDAAISPSKRGFQTRPVYSPPKSFLPLHLWD